ncbi:MAG: DUF2382 domain-containing protein [Cyanobacteriota bacterium]|nr:DUF2382 domain-containing protein [Cyanobacteriota bacterium]
MALVKISDFYPDYKQQVFEGEEIKDYSVYNDRDEKIGGVHDILLDETGRFRYFVIDTGFWIFGKQVLLPIGRARMDYANQRVYVLGLTKEQAENLPEYRSDMTVDYDYEERVRSTYRPTAGAATTQNYTRHNYNYEYDPALYQANEQDRAKIRLYEERLIADKDPRKAGEVAVGKTVETETARVSVPVEKERVVIERTTPTNATPVTPGTANFREGEVARVEVYEESADIEKQAYVREEVEVRKEVDRETVESTETIRREKLDVDADGKPVVNQR